MPIYPEGFEPPAGGLLAFFGGLVDEGLSQNRAIVAFRAAGGRGTNDLLRATYNFARESGEGRPTGWAFPVDQTIDPEAHRAWPAESDTGYGYPITLHVTGPGGFHDTIDTMFKSDVPLSPEEAYQGAADQLMGGEDEAGERYAIEVHGGGLRSEPWVFVPMGP